jgi:hypothetical protein
MHLAQRLPASAIGEAARSGLQDSAPRAALLSLHARLHGVRPDSWEHPELAQIWFRFADYVVPRDLVGVFTVGTLPRDPAAVSALDRLADMVHRVLEGRSRPTREVTARIADLPDPLMLRAVCATGRVHIRWDARTVRIVPAEAPAIDPEDARLELARHFLRFLGPARPEHFCKWAMLTRDDATRTWAALSPELVEIDVAGGSRFMLEADVDRMQSARPPEGVRLLPPGEPYLYNDHDLLVRTAEREPLQPGPSLTRRLINSLSGRILVDGEVVGAFGRVRANVAIRPWRRLNSEERMRIDAEAQLLREPLGRPPGIRWLESRTSIR